MKNKLILFALYSIVLLILGRNLSFLPQFGQEKTVEAKDSGQIQSDVQTVLSQSEGLYSVYYENLNTGQSFGIEENRVLTGASLHKLFIVGYLYSLADRGELDLSEKVTIQEGDIQDYGTGSIRYEEPGQTYSLQALARLAFKQSDNTASYVLGIRLGTDEVQRFVDDLGLSSTDIENNKTTARDVGTFFKLLYSHQITNEALTEELFDYLSDTDFEDRLPLFIAEKARVIHKTGDATNMVHDAGIILGNTDPFVLAVLSSEIADEEKAKVVIGKIANATLGQASQ